MSVTTARDTVALVELLAQVEGKAEITTGKIVTMSPTGGMPGEAGGAIFAELRSHAKGTGHGRAVPDNVAFIVNLARRRSFSPDAAYWTGEAPTMKFYEGAPIFAVEVRSENDYGPKAEAEIAAKRADYFAAGTLVVWDVDLPSADVVKSYRASDPQAPLVFRRGEKAHAEPAVPGWTMAVDELFA